MNRKSFLGRLLAGIVAAPAAVMIAKAVEKPQDKSEVLTTGFITTTYSGSACSAPPEAILTKSGNGEFQWVQMIRVNEDGTFIQPSTLLKST